METDNESIYDKHISPLLNQILQVCLEHEVPIFATFQLITEPDKNHYTMSSLFEEFGKEKFKMHIKFSNEDKERFAGVAVRKNDAGEFLPSVIASHGYSGHDLEDIAKVAIDRASNEGRTQYNFED